MTRLLPLSAATLAALAAWLSLGTIGLASLDGGRLAVLPLSAVAAAAVLAAAGGVLLMRRAGASLAPVALLGLVCLPWLPVDVPPAFMIWVRPVSVLIWIAVAGLMAWSIGTRGALPIGRPHLAAAAAACVLFGFSAWRAAPMVPGGDEPHYLVITQSLLLDGDLTIEDVHRRGDYRAYYAGDLPPHVQRRGQDGAIYSVHAPGLPVLVAPAFAVGGYRAVVVFLVLLASAGAALVWHLAWTATGRADAAWFGWATVTLPVTAIFQSFSVYPDGPGGVLALTGLWAVMRADRESRDGTAAARPWLLHGALLALLPWLHSRFAVLAGGLGALVLLRLSTTRNPAGKAVAFLSVPAVSAVLWMGFFVAIYGTPDPTAPYGRGEIGSFAFVPGGVGGLLFDQRFGVLAYAPVVACAGAGLAWMLAGPEHRRLGLELLFVAVPYLLTVTHFAMWWGGWSAPARFFAPILPLCAVPAAVFWSRAARPARALGVAALAFTAAASAVVVWVDRGRLAFNTRESTALWLEWAGRVADLTAAAPLWARETDGPLFRAIAVWVGVTVGVWLALRGLQSVSWLRRRAAYSTAAAALMACGVMVAASVVWTLGRSGGQAVIASQLHLLERMAAEPRAAAFTLDAWSRLPAAELPTRLRLELSRTPSARPVGRDMPAMFALPPLPAGDYRISVTSGASRGWVMLGIARDQFAIRTEQLPARAIDLRFPLPVRGLLVRGDEDARRAVRGLLIEPLRIRHPADRLSADVARRAVRYGQSTVYFLDERSYPEPDAFWIGGARDSRVVVQPDAPRHAVVLSVRNAPVANRVTLEAGSWRDDLALEPGETREMAVPVDAARGGTVLRIASEAGFRPSEHEQGSGDHRFLGVYVRVE